MALAQTIKLARLRLALTQQDLADRLGVDKQSVSNWERGTTPSSRHLPALAQILKVPLTALGSDLSVGASGPAVVRTVDDAPDARVYMNRLLATLGDEGALQSEIDAARRVLISP